MSPTEIDQAAALRLAKHTWREIAALVRYDKSTVRHAVLRAHPELRNPRLAHAVYLHSQGHSWTATAVRAGYSDVQWCREAVRRYQMRQDGRNG